MKVFIGGAIGRYFEPDHVLSLMALFPSLYKRTGQIPIYKPQFNDALLDRARSVCATNFLENTDADVLLSIDSDIVFQPEDAIRICESAMGRSIVGGVYITRGKGALCYPTSLPFNGERILFANDSTPVPFRYIATGFVAVHRRVFEALAKRADCPMCHEAEKWRFRPFYQPFAHDWDGTGLRYLSEDWAFCQRAADEGFESFIDPSVRIQHLGLHPFRLDDMLDPPMREQSPLYLTRESDGNYIREVPNHHRADSSPADRDSVGVVAAGRDSAGPGATQHGSER